MAVVSEHLHTLELTRVDCLRCSLVSSSPQNEDPASGSFCSEPSPICSTSVPAASINDHIDSECATHTSSQHGPSTSQTSAIPSSPSVHAATQSLKRKATNGKTHIAPIFSLTKKRPPVTAKAASESEAQPAEDDIFILEERNLEEPSSKRPKVLSTAKPVKNALRDAAPLAERMRPQSLDEFIGQEHLVGKDSLLRNLLETGQSGSLIMVRASPRNYLGKWANLYFIVENEVGTAWDRFVLCQTSVGMS
jgi:hypothetical protein